MSSNVYVQDPKNRGMGDTLLFLSHCYNVEQGPLAISDKCIKVNLIRDIIPFLDHDIRIVSDKWNIVYDYWDTYMVKKHIPIKHEYLWDGECYTKGRIGYQLNGAWSNPSTKNLPQSYIDEFCSKLHGKGKSTVDIHAVSSIKDKIHTLQRCEHFYGIESGNAVLAEIVGVPFTPINVHKKVHSFINVNHVSYRDLLASL
jgi:hypothetical protein